MKLIGFLLICHILLVDQRRLLWAKQENTASESEILQSNASTGNSKVESHEQSHLITRDNETFQVESVLYPSYSLLSLVITNNYYDNVNHGSPITITSDGMYYMIKPNDLSLTVAIPITIYVSNKPLSLDNTELTRIKNAISILGVALSPINLENETPGNPSMQTPIDDPDLSHLSESSKEANEIMEDSPDFEPTPVLLPDVDLGTDSHPISNTSNEPTKPIDSDPIPDSLNTPRSPINLYNSPINNPVVYSEEEAKFKSSIKMVEEENRRNADRPSAPLYPILDPPAPMKSYDPSKTSSAPSYGWNVPNPSKTSSAPSYGWNVPNPSKTSTHPSYGWDTKKANTTTRFSYSFNTPGYAMYNVSTEPLASASGISNITYYYKPSRKYMNESLISVGMNLLKTIFSDDSRQKLIKQESKCVKSRRQSLNNIISDNDILPSENFFNTRLENKFEQKYIYHELPGLATMSFNISTNNTICVCGAEATDIFYTFCEDLYILKRIERIVGKHHRILTQYRTVFNTKNQYFTVDDIWDVKNNGDVNAISFMENKVTRCFTTNSWQGGSNMSNRINSLDNIRIPALFGQVIYRDGFIDFNALVESLNSIGATRHLDYIHAIIRNFIATKSSLRPFTTIELMASTGDMVSTNLSLTDKFFIMREIYNDIYRLSEKDKYNLSIELKILSKSFADEFFISQHDWNYINPEQNVLVWLLYLITNPGKMTNPTTYTSINGVINDIHEAKFSRVPLLVTDPMGIGFWGKMSRLLGGYSTKSKNFCYNYDRDEPVIIIFTDANVRKFVFM